MLIFIVIALIIAIIAVIFALQNAITITISFFIWQFDGSLALILLLTLALGFLISFFATLPALIRRSWTIAGQKRRIGAIEKQLLEAETKNEALDQQLRTAVQIADEQQTTADLLRSQPEQQSPADSA
jgi:putative membrane protein